MILPPAVILCGGLATRLGELTRKTPKSMLPIRGRPFIDWQLANIQAQGIKEVVLCTGHLEAPIREHVGNGRHHGLRVSYSHEEVPLGTAGALRQALPLLPDTFFVTYGDSYLDTSWRGVYQKFLSAKKPGLITAFPNKTKWDISNIRIADGSVRYYAAPTESEPCNYIDYGLLVMTRKLLQSNENEKDFKRVLSSLSQEDLLAYNIVQEQFYEIGSRIGLQRLEKYLSQNHEKPRTIL